MGSLPREKAGVGSAINDTTRQVGGALGVAIIGSAVSSAYANRVATAANDFGLDGVSNADAQSSLGGAQKVAATLSADAAGFLRAANQAFVDSMSIGLRVSAGVVVFAAVMAWRFLPSHAASDDSTTAVPGVVSAPGAAPSTVGAATPAGASLRTSTPDVVPPHTN